MLSEVDCGAHETHTSGYMLSNFDWDLMIQAFSFTRMKLTMIESQKTSSLRTTWRTTKTKLSTPVMCIWKVLWLLYKLMMDLINSSLFKTTDRINLAFLTYIPFLQYINWRFRRCLCSGNRGFGNERI